MAHRDRHGRLSWAPRLPGFGILMFGITFIGIGLSVTRPYLSLFGTDVIGMTPAELGTFLCINSLGGILASTWLGKQSDANTPKKDIVLLACLCSGLGYLSFMFIHNYWLLTAISTVLLGIGTAAFPQMFAYAREAAAASENTEATMAISTLRSFFSLAWVIGPLLGAWGLSLLGYNGLFVTTCAIFLMVFVLVLFRLERRPSAGRRRLNVEPLMTNLRRREVLVSGLALVLAFTAASMNGMYMPLFVHRTLRAPEHVVGWVFSLSAGLEIPVMLVLGLIADRIGKKAVLVAGTLSGILYFVGVIFTHYVWEMLALQVLCAVFISVMASIGMSYFQDLMPESPGSATTLYSNTNNIGSMAGSLVGGNIAQVFGLRQVYWCCILLGICTCICLLLAKPRRMNQGGVSAQSPKP